MSRPAIGILTRIADDRRRRIDAMERAEPAYALRARLGPPRPAGRLERALRRGAPAAPLRLLCEFKRASPSKGVLNATADPLIYARLYEAGGAAALSLVTEPDHFGGDLAWMPQVRAAVGLPLLLKDFVLDSYQLLDAAARGADGVLLLAALLSGVQLQRLIGEARLLGLDALVEVHDEHELEVALNLDPAPPELIGINNRDLKTLEVDTSRTFTLLARVSGHALVISESGFSRPEQLNELAGAGVDGVLVGEALMRSPDVEAACRALTAR